MITLRKWLEEVYLERESLALEGMTEEIDWKDLITNGIVPLASKPFDELIYGCEIHGYYCPNCDEAIPFNQFKEVNSEKQAACPCCNKEFTPLT